MNEETVSSLEEMQLLMTIPGMNIYSSLLITAEIDRFETAEQVVSHGGLDPIVRESADSRTEGGSRNVSVVTCGGFSSNVEWALHRCNDPYLGQFYGQLKDRKIHKIAIVATARKLLISMTHSPWREIEH